VLVGVQLIIFGHAMRQISSLTWVKLEIIVFPSSLWGCTICLRWWWLSRMTWESLLVLIVKGCGMLNTTPISPATSEGPIFDKTWTPWTYIFRTRKNLLYIIGVDLFWVSLSFPESFLTLVCLCYPISLNSRKYQY